MKRAFRLVGALLLALVVAGAAFVLVQANRRPSLEPYAALTLPAAPATPPMTTQLRARFAGVATLVFDDGETAWMVDGFFTRPPALRTLFGKIAPDEAAIRRGLARLNVDRLAAVVPAHSHYDHAMDSPLVAKKTGALLIGSESTLNVGHGLGLGEDRMRKVAHGDAVEFGKWKLTFIASRHGRTPYSDGLEVETIERPLVPPAHATAWREGQTWVIHVEHASGATMLVAGSAGFIEGSLAGRHADVVFLGTGGAGRQSRDYRAALWDETVRRVGARRVIPIHWDDFWQPLDPPLIALPYLIDDFGVTMADFARWSERDGVELRLPPLFAAFAPLPAVAPDAGSK